MTRRGNPTTICPDYTDGWPADYQTDGAPSTDIVPFRYLALLIYPVWSHPYVKDADF